MSTGLSAFTDVANSPATTADAGDASARRRFFSSSTKTNVPGEAESMLEIPDSPTLESPTTRACTASAISCNERFMILFLYVSPGKGKPGLECNHGEEGLLDRLRRARSGGRF